MRDFITIHSFEFEQVQENEGVDDCENCSHHQGYGQEHVHREVFPANRQEQERNGEGEEKKCTGEFEFHKVSIAFPNMSTPSGLFSVL
jgi:hypothetical protein